MPTVCEGWAPLGPVIIIVTYVCSFSALVSHQAEGHLLKFCFVLCLRSSNFTIFLKKQLIMQNIQDTSHHGH